jgi:hypothetical protein
MFSSIATSSQTAELFSTYAAFATDCIKRNALGSVDVDELREIANDLWTLHDNFAEGGDEGLEGAFGEDD